MIRDRIIDWLAFFAGLALMFSPLVLGIVLAVLVWWLIEKGGFLG